MQNEIEQRIELSPADITTLEVDAIVESFQKMN